MPVVKGGVWTNIEDEILKAAISKYGPQQWARVSSLLNRKTAKQCKARWMQWLDPGIRKVEWSKEEDEILLQKAKEMSTQWETIAKMIVGRTANQCIERYQKLLDEAETRENDGFGLGGPTGGETAAPTADDVRRLRPGEVDPDPESKPARPDTIDLDEDEKEMLSEARARLANTQGKKAKRKARERQLEESRRVANLQKRREMKNMGINMKIGAKKKGQMDYNADIPFEKHATSGFYDTAEEMAINEREREAFDPRKQQLATKRKGDPEEDSENKRRKGEKGGQSASNAAAARAGQLQRIREAEQSAKRRALVLPAPQVGENELEDIVKMGMAGDKANQLAGQGDNEATRGLVVNYSGMVGGTPIRTPRAPPQDDRIAREIRNIRALTDAQSSLLGGENTPLHEDVELNGFERAAPGKNVIQTPNPMATPFRQPNGVGATPIRGSGPGATPLRTPRDNFALNQEYGMQPPGSTPREIKLHEQAQKNSLKSNFAALPKPKESEWELELPEEQQLPADAIETQEDAAERDRRNTAIRKAAEQADLKRRTQVIQKSLPRPTIIDLDSRNQETSSIENPYERAILREKDLLVANDALKFPLPGTKIHGTPTRQLEKLPDASLASARQELLREAETMVKESDKVAFDAAIGATRENSALPGLEVYYSSDDEDSERTVVTTSFNVR